MNHIAGSSANITLLVRKLHFSKLQADTDYNFGVTICNLTTTRTLLLLKHYCHNWWFRPKMKSLLYIIYGIVLSLQNENPGVRQGCTAKISFPSLSSWIFGDWDYKSIGKVKSSLPRPRQDETGHSIHSRSSQKTITRRLTNTQFLVNECICIKYLFRIEIISFYNVDWFAAPTKVSDRE